MTCKRVHKSLSQTLCKPYSNCNVKGIVKTLKTICYDIFREIKLESINYSNYNSFILISSREIIEYIEKK